MQIVTTFLGLVSKTQGRDKVLRLFQYLCLHAVDIKQKNARFKVYQQMRMTRKMLRFLRTLDFAYKINAQFPELSKTSNQIPMFLKHLTNILQNIFTFLFNIADHRVCLSELNVLSEANHKAQYLLSMKFYFLQNIFGILNNICCSVISGLQIKESKDFKKFIRAIKFYSFDMIRCFLDCLVALYYWKKIFSAKVAGVIGVITSIMAIMQSIQKM